MRATVLAISLATASAFTPTLRSRTRARPVPRTVIRAAAEEHFPDVGKIPYEGPDSKNPMAFSYYSEGECRAHAGARVLVSACCSRSVGLARPRAASARASQAALVE